MRELRATAPRAAFLLLLVFAMTAALSSCGGSSKPAVCSDLNHLQTSVGDLKKINLSRDTLNQVSAQLSTIANDLKSVQADAKQRFQPQLAAVEAAYARLKTTVASARTAWTAGSLAAIASAVKQLGSSFDSLRTAAQNTC